MSTINATALAASVADASDPVDTLASMIEALPVGTYLELGSAVYERIRSVGVGLCLRGSGGFEDVEVFACLALGLDPLRGAL